ncbi:RagB/SusD family nutrient uptake outer membrane protein [Chitinophaga rhizophila]|uniref:RagB/SusD family nutrient uptake outer membrane protein n=1 Tax=Chitinophaga rhizophila TaxID=2866212 RepID=A0ABS7G9T3_9BACT|nr:RagB/SusD family nutrient uptake outer membrane protein [Chitinophaga rhizophila]MBW8683477.1 RagB/SusD family nutrient uptake outer membrane protein [Chitinophaga rhizophila]
MRKLNCWKSTLLYPITLCMALPACHFIENAELTTKRVFSNDSLANMAVIGMYGSMANDLNMSSGATTVFTGIWSDELRYTRNEADLLDFNIGKITAGNDMMREYFWAKPYHTIYLANNCIENLRNNNKLTDTRRNQFLGECLFFRAFQYFNMVQLFSDVPLVLVTNPHVSEVLPRTPVSEIYKQMISDFIEADTLLPPNYPEGRYRATQGAAEAMLAKCYLYQKKWSQAESYASRVIETSGTELERDIRDVFLANNNDESLLHFISDNDFINTIEGAVFAPNTKIPNFILTDSLLNDFEFGDKRRTAWLDSSDYNGDIMFYPYKYKLPGNSGVRRRESYMLLRLAEQYFIRAEARIELGNLEGAIQDIDAIRLRAGLPRIKEKYTNISQNSLRGILRHEKRIEFFAEWGHRWYDLKRWGIASQVLKNKFRWEEKDLLWPIPYKDLMLNRNLTQNPGYDY